MVECGGGASRFYSLMQEFQLSYLLQARLQEGEFPLVYFSHVEIRKSNGQERQLNYDKTLLLLMFNQSFYVRNEHMHINLEPKEFRFQQAGFFHLPGILEKKLHFHRKYPEKGQDLSKSLWFCNKQIICQVNTK